ncbi:hypothetical protein [Ferrovibrio sp.]|uniref:hypothetical protein n=1 Tax=Ferrovibrio sp. TaxID=1917215 RepID=UPI00311FECDE
MKLLCIRQLGALRPADEADREALSKIGLGEMVEIEIRRKRNLGRYRLYRAMIRLVWEHMDHDVYPTAEDLHDAFKIRLGLRKRIELPGGEYGYIAESTAFDKMGETEFADYFGRARDLVVAEFLPGVTEPELRRELEQMTGIAGMEAR